MLHDAYQDSKRQDELGLVCICLQLHANQASTVGMRAERLTEGILEQTLVNRPANRKKASGHPTAKVLFKVLQQGVDLGMVEL